MIVDEGLFPGMVLQRGRFNQCHARFSGRCRASGTVLARVRAGGKTLGGWKARKVGMARRGRFAGVIKGLAVGGPYDIELCIDGGKDVSESLMAKDVLVGDVWVLAGQSNMEGIGWLKDKLPGQKLVRAFYMNDEWGVAEDPLHTRWCAVDTVHGGNPKASRTNPTRFVGVGPGVGFGQSMQRIGGVPQGLLACGHGGTRMVQWDPALKARGGASFYGAMCRRVKKNGGVVAGVFWYQGCSDTGAEEASKYTGGMKKLIKSMRRDLGNSRLPVVVVQISRMTTRNEPGEYWDSIREQQRRLPEHIDRLVVVPAIDLPLDDSIHLSGQGQNILGARAAQAMAALVGVKGAGPKPIEVREVVVRANPVSAMADIVVSFAKVMGSLVAAGRPTGFSFDSHVMPHNYHRIDLHRNTAILRLNVPVDNVEGNLYYGSGVDPYCNITDEGGRSLPAFGPLPMVAAEPRALTRFVTRVHVSPILPGVEIQSLEYREDIDLTPRQFAGTFCDRHLELGEAGEALVYYSFRFRCAKPMKLKFLLGYDGPVKAWLDKNSIFCDPEGTNPAHAEEAVIPLAVAAGNHEMRVALGSHGMAWGVFMRFERSDVSRRMLRRQPQTVILPTIE